MDTSRERIAASHAKAIEHIETAIATVTRVIETTKLMMEQGSGDMAVNEQRIVDGENELAALHAELEALRSGDRDALNAASSTFPPSRHEQHPEL